MSTPRVLAAMVTLLLSACGGVSGVRPDGLAPTDLPVDLARFMGDWYVIAHIPLSAEQDAHEALESYRLREDGDIEVRFRFCEGSVDGPAEEFSFRAWVHDPETNAEWRVRPIWPLALAYQIAALDPDYRETVITSGANAWIMAREPSLPEPRRAELEAWLAEQGFDTTRLRSVPHDDGRCRAEA